MYRALGSTVMSSRQAQHPRLRRETRSPVGGPSLMPSYSTRKMTGPARLPDTVCGWPTVPKRWPRSQTSLARPRDYDEHESALECPPGVADDAATQRMADAGLWRPDLTVT